MSRLLCCLRARRPDMGAALSHPQEGGACDGGAPASPPTMADVIRERKKKAGGAGLGTLRRRIAAAARRPRDARPDRGCEHARFIRSVVSSWRLAEVFLLCEELEAGAALRDLATQAELAREPAPALHADLARLHRDRWWCDVEVVGAGWSLPAHRVILAARCTYFRDLLVRFPNSCRIPLEGVGGALSRDEVEACVLALYAGTAATTNSSQRCDRCSKWDRGMDSEAELDIISVENSTLRRGCSCGRPRVDAARLRRLADLLGFSPDTLHRDMRYLLDSGELCDARLSWQVEGAAGAGAAGHSYGFRNALELPCHRLLLAARSRFFRSVMSRRSATAGGAVCVDEKVLPRRFARALLHAAYTDQVDLTLIGRISSSPSSTSSSGNGGTLRGGAGRGCSLQMLDDAFQLYEIARFLEMPIVAQGCEDALARALTADTLPHVLRWAAAPHASAWLYRQATRLLRDEFPAAMAAGAAGRLPRAALAAALGSPFLQASEAQALRALLRWAERAAAPPDRSPEPNLVWHTTHGRRGARTRGRRAPHDAIVREALGELLPLLRLEHLPPDCDILQQAVRRGIVPAPPQPERGAADAWLGRGAFRPPRCFLPYLDEIKALLEDQALPEAELSRARLRLAQRIPDTLYMVAAARRQHEADGASAGSEGARACVSARTLAALRARVAELRGAAPAQRALRLHAPDTLLVRRQIALRAVREMSLPDSCADLLLSDADVPSDRESGAEWEGREGREGRVHSASRSDGDDDCCRSGSGSLRCVSGGSSTIASIDNNQRAGTCRRELPARPLDVHHRSGSWSRGRLSAAVPDVAMAPNANTHLLTARDYPHPHPHPHAHAHPLHVHGSELVGVLQLDLGDGATHTPRPGSRAQRAARQHRDHSQSGCTRRDSDELRAAIELSVMRAYSSLQVARRGPSHIADLLPPPDFASIRNRSTPSPSSLSQAAQARPRVSTTNSTDRRGCVPGASGSGTNGTHTGGALSERNGALNDRNGSLSDRSGTLSERNGTLSERNGTHIERNGAHSDRSGSLSERNGAHIERNGSHSDRSGTLSERNGIHIERSGSHSDRSGTLSERSGVNIERNGAHIERNGAHVERNGTHIERNGSHSDRSGTLSERSGVHIERNGAHIERNGSHSDRSGTLSERSGVHIERNGAHIERNGAHIERNGSHSDRSGTLSERNGVHIERSGSHSDRSGTLSERNGSHGDRNGLLNERNGTLSERNGLLSERNGTLSERNGSLSAGGTLGRSRSPSPRRSPYPLYTLYTQRDYRAESYGRGRSQPRGHSPAYA